jgi:excisionase family DNA binding protein
MDVSVQQAAALLGVTDRTIRRYIASQRLKARKRNLKSFAINVEELRKFALANDLILSESAAQQLAQNQ